MKMFRPKFTITNKILDNIADITAAREIILNSLLVPGWEVSLRKDAIIRNAHASTSIEGNPLSLEEVSELAAGRDVMAARKSKQEVLNYLYVLENLSDFALENKITEDTILKTHENLTKDALDNPQDVGKYRDRQVFVGNRLTGEVIFMPPKTENVPRLMKGFVEWLNSREVREMNPVLVAGISHYEFVRIHPFIDGNGRCARTLATLILYLRGFDTKRFFALDDYYDSDRPAYYAVLKSVDKKTRDLTQWLEYFTEGVKVSMVSVKERVLRLSSERLRKDKRGQIVLTERQMRIVEHINLNGKITNRDVRYMFNLSDEGALKEIKKLLKLKVIKSRGKGRALHYVLQ